MKKDTKESNLKVDIKKENEEDNDKENERKREDFKKRKRSVHSGLRKYLILVYIC